MTDVETKSRNSMTAADRLEARERTNAVARETLAEERRRRDARTERLKHARLQAEEQARQL